MKIKGNDLIVMVRLDGGWKTAAFGTTCELDVSADTIAVGNNRDGRWLRRKVKRFSWHVTSGHLMSDVAQDVDLYALMTAAQEVSLAFTTVGTHDLPMADPPQYTPTDVFRLTGTAVITRFTVTGRRGDYATMSAAFDGSGKLSATPAPSQQHFTTRAAGGYQNFIVTNDID